ncbi:MAG: adenylate/guanylate cyclase domain-containing protein [Ignavibacteriales bacterium]|nr:MAG: adenylate/guanylate cyclase domain-containing protein [Ignavibacteriales bacterium]
MSKKVFNEESANPLNQKLDDLEKVIQKKDELIKDEEKIIGEIRAGFQKRVVVFVDMVDSTKYKIEKKDEPEKWILRVWQFSEIIKEYIEECGGKVVKYIGDELMGIFERKTKIDDALSFVMRIKDMEKNLYEVTNEATKIKMALDYGDVYLIEYEGHSELDPQGTAVDRCARIGKYCNPSTILTSFEFLNECSYPKQWNMVGEVELKGLGLTKIYQFGDKTVIIEKKVEIAENHFDNLKKQIQELTSSNQDLEIELKDCQSKNLELLKKLKDKKEVVDKNLKAVPSSKEDEKSELWQKVRNKISDLKTIIREAGVPEYEYGRFLFLYMRDEEDKWNVFEGKNFDATYERNLIETGSADGYYQLNTENRRNKKAISIMDEIEKYLQKYVEKYRDDDDDLFDYSLSDPEFWSNYISINVS